jgi:hypothetical protein
MYIDRLGNRNRFERKKGFFFGLVLVGINGAPFFFFFFFFLL